MKKLKMTTLRMEIALMVYFDIRKNLVIPNVTRMSGLAAFETDMLVLSKSGFATGVEIKVSKSDLKNDIKKRQWRKWDDGSWQQKNHYKSYFGTLKYFYYAVPVSLVEAVVDQVPPWCGILIIDDNTVYSNNVSRVDYVKVHREPVKLFDTKWSEEKKYKLARLGALRILKYKKKANEIIRKIEIENWGAE
jgi:hypothetical protein